MNNYMQLYNINQEIFDLINNGVDEETGELTTETSERFQQLQLKKEDIIQSIGLTHIVNKAEAEKVNEEIKRLQSIKSHYSRREEAAKKMLQKFIRLGEEYKFSNLVVKYQKNPHRVIVDDLIDLERLHDAGSALIIKDISYSLDNKLIKEYYKNGKPLPEGISVAQEFSLRIK